MSGRSKQYSHWIPDQQMARLRSVSTETGITVSELMRRMYDYCLQGKVLNELVPAMSGQIQKGG